MITNRIIDDGPFDETVHPRYGQETHVLTGAEMNQVRAELMSARAIAGAYRRSKLKGYYRSLRGDVALAIDAYDRGLPR